MNADVFVLEDLVSRKMLDAGHDKPAILAVLGFPVSHSASPAMHQPALDACGIDGRYIRLEVPVGRVAEALLGLSKLGFVGANVTVPHKFAALDACHQVDGLGFARAIREEFMADLSGQRVMIIGAGGGAGQAIATQCARDGAERLVLANRTLEKVETLAVLLRRRFPATKFHCVALADPQLEGVARQCQILVNTSSVGMRADDASPVGANTFASHHLVYDTIYKPPMTSFLRQALLQHASVANGFSMLLHQGVLAFDIWYPGQAPLEIMRQGLRSVS
jgi:shikimate dehydrogenase